LYLGNKKDELPVDLQKIPIGDWDVSRVTNMRAIFHKHVDFNESLNNWDVSNVTNMEYIFWKCRTFNQPLDKWGDKLGKVTNMNRMFNSCTNFNQPLDNWNVSNVIYMNDMFGACKNFNQPLNNWNVGNVMNMSEMFQNCEKFNQPLNNWNVSNVTKMGHMFSDCENFNQPLNNWNVRNVTDMNYMFSNCKNFNQPLNNWNVVQNQGMFDGCKIYQENKPRIRIINVDDTQIHTETGKINFQNLNSFLKDILNKEIPRDINYSKYIKNTISNFIKDSDESEGKKNEQHNGLDRIMSERLDNLNYQDQSPLIRESIFYVLEYVKQQSSIFKNMYVASFIKDCVHAYEGPDGMTCALGALERITLSLPPSCAAEGNDECEILVGIILADPNKLIPEYIKEWYQLHKGGFPDKTEHDIEQNLIDYLKDKMPRDKFPEVNIENLIKVKVNEIKLAIGFDPDAFTYGGKKRKTRKNRKTNIRKTTKKG
jgi:surface protein